MLENISNSVIFYSHYTEGGVNKTGLTVTIDVYEVIRDGTATLVVDDGACTEIGAGLYRYLLAAATVDAAAEYVGVFHTATATVDAQDIPAIWVINRAGTETLDSGVSLADDAITSAKYDESTAFPVKKADALTTELARLDSASSYKADVSAITGAALSASGIDAILDEVVVGTYTMRQLLAVMGAALAGKVTGGGTTAITFRGINDASDVIVATVDANGNRSAVTVTV
jgi:hypothetical protein